MSDIVKSVYDLEDLRHFMRVKRYTTSDLAFYSRIPRQTLHYWLIGRRKPPAYVVDMLVKLYLLR